MINRSILLLLVSLSTVAFARETIENNHAPAGKAQTIHFEKLFGFGADDDEDHFLWAGESSMVRFGHKDHIFVSDADGKRVLEFDDKGAFVKVFGPSGAGPGEYRGAPAFFPLKKGGAVGFDMVPNTFPRVNLYDNTLTYKDSQNFSGGHIPVAVFGFSPDGSLFACFAIKLDPQSGKMKFISCLMDMNFEIIKQFHATDRNLPDRQRLTDPAFWEDYLAVNYKELSRGTAHFGFDAAGNIYTALSDKYEITKWSPDLKTKLMVINKKFKPLPMNNADIDGIVESATAQIRKSPVLGQIVTEAVVRRAVEKAELPPVKNPIYGLVVTDDGHLLVMRDLGLADGVQFAELFSPHGKYLGEVRMKDRGLYDLTSNRPRISFSGDKAVTTHIDEDGEIRVVAYRWKVGP